MLAELCNTRGNGRREKIIDPNFRQDLEVNETFVCGTNILLVSELDNLHSSLKDAFSLRRTLVIS